MKEDKKFNFLLKIGIALSILLAMFLLTQGNILGNSSVVLAADKQEQDYCYLSDIPYESSSSVGWGSITYDRNLDSKVNNGLINLIVNGEKKQFFKGISAHATSTLIYDISEYNYDYFTAYLGVDEGRGDNGDGVQFAISTSVDGENWDLKTPASYPIMKGNTESRFEKIDIKGAKYLKLYASQRRNNTADHAVYADAKLIKEGYEPGEATKVDFIKTAQQYDEEIKKFNGQEITGEYEKALLRKEFVNNVGYDLLQFLATYKTSYSDTIKWLMNGDDLVDGTDDDVENLRYYILGGTPTGSYSNSLEELTRLYTEYKNDFAITDPISDEGIRRLHNRKPDAPITKGDLYKRMAITLSLTHSSTVALWMQPSLPVNQSDSVVRYQIYKDMYNQGKFKATDAVNITPWFESYNIEEMRYVMNTLIDDEEIIWLNEYTQSKIDAEPNRAWSYLTPHPYMAYVWPNYSNPVYYADENYDYFNELFSVGDKKLYDYDITRGTADNKVYKLWMNFRNKFGTGAVCGGISKTGHCIRGVNAIPSAVIGQPGHAAIIYYTQDSEGNGYWGIDNDVSGWTLSEKGERMPLGWGNASYSRGYSVVYIALAQEAMNDRENLEKCQTIMLQAKAYADDPVKQEEIYREALKVQPINIDAWYGLYNAYCANTEKTENDFYELAKEMAEALKNFPLPMYHLTNLIKPKMVSVENSYRFTLLQTRILNEGKDTPNNTADNYTVYQPSLTRLEANHILGNLDTTIATFSFDGEDANKIVLSSRFDGNGVRWDYCIDGNPTGGLEHWHEVAFDGGEEHKWQLTQEELKSITSENDIYIHIVGVNYAEENLYKIDILDSEGLPSDLYANDLENKLIAAVPGIEWKLNETDEWTLYGNAEPDLTGDKNIFVRMAATGVHLVGETVEYQFTRDEVNDKRKYIPISHLEIAGYSTQSKDNKRPFYAPNAIDGNPNTLWHTDFGQNVLQQSTKPFISIKLDEPKNISALEFIQTKYPGRPQDPDDIKNARVYVGIDGETWIQAGQIENCETYGDLYSINFEKPVYGQYVKIEMDTTNMFASLAMVNLYEDTTVVTLATFSFDGENARKLMLVDEFKGARWEYSLDGGTTWKNGNGDAHQLTKEEIAQINTDDKIKIRLNNNESTIEIQKQDTPVITAYLNDLENRLIGITNTEHLEWRIESNTDNWTSYSEQEPIVFGDTKLLIRKKAVSTLLASDSVEFVFTDDNQPDTAKYIPIKHLSIEGFSSTTVPSRGEEAEFAIDGLPTTMWHTSRTTSTMKDPRWVIIKLDEPKYISEIEYVRKAGYAYGIPKNGKISVSMDGENWEEAVEFENLYNVTTPEELSTSENNKTIKLGKSKQAQYIKIECTESCDSVHGNRDGVPMDYFFSAAMFNLFEDTTKITIPTAEIEYNITEMTNQDVIATLVNESTEITVTNNDGSKTHTFTEDGEFTFEFVDSKGTKGTATAKVNWIRKTLPTPTIQYTPDTLTNGDVTATVTFDRDNVKILNEAGEEIEKITTGNAYTYTFTENGSHEIRFEGPYGNRGTTTATVDWIDKVAPKATITYSSTNLSNKDVTATITFDEENVTVKDGNTHTFTENGDYTFEFEDLAGNKGTAEANVTWIDKDLPTASISYSTTDLTNEDVTATVTFDKDGVKIVDEQGEEIEDGNEYTFTENGTHEFKFVGTAGNTGVAIAKVDWIDKEAPVGTIEYSTRDLTNQDVTATITFDEEDVTITNNGGKNTYTFEINGEFEFEFVDKIGNKGTAKAEVEWIDKRAVNATITYDINDITNKDVTAKISFDKANVTILNNDGSDTYVFTENGTFEFSFIGPAGNRGTALAEVTWIDKIPPVATVSYSTKESTTEPVTATVTFDEGGVTMINENGEEIENGDTYIFTQNGTHTFYYRGPLGNIGTAVANVSWISKDGNEFSSDVYTIDEEHKDISRIAPETTVAKFIENVTTNQELTFVDKDGNQLNDDSIIKTGTVVKAGDMGEYTIIVTGDVDGDGKITINDLAQMKLHIIGIRLLTGINLKAANIDNDNIMVSINDIAQMKLVLIGMLEIK